MDPTPQKQRSHAKGGVPLAVNVANNERMRTSNGKGVGSTHEAPGTSTVFDTGNPQIPVISVTRHRQPLSAEQHPEDSETNLAIQQSQDSYNSLGFVEFESPCSPSSHAFDSSEEEYYRNQHRLDYGWHTDTEYDRRSVIEEPDDDLVLSPVSSPHSVYWAAVILTVC